MDLSNMVLMKLFGRLTVSPGGPPPKTETSGVNPAHKDGHLLGASGSTR
jgi:hypothetical protein